MIVGRAMGQGQRVAALVTAMGGRLAAQVREIEKRGPAPAEAAGEEVPAAEAPAEAAPAAEAAGEGGAAGSETAKPEGAE